MIPYFTLTAFSVGPLHIQVWGLFVALGILAAVMLGARHAARLGLDRESWADLAFWVILGAFAGARLFHAFAYDPAPYLQDPLKLLRIWEGGMSSYGGFIGAAIAGVLFLRRRKLAFMPYADLAAFVLPLGYGIGRIGCFLIHDHPGTLSRSLFSVRFPEGPRFDHGLLLSSLGFAIFGIFLILERRRPAIGRGRYFALFLAIYGAARFLLDFFRARDIPGADARYLALTPAQYGALAMMAAVAVWWLVNQLKLKKYA